VLPIIEDTLRRWSTNGVRMTSRFDQIVTCNRCVVNEWTQVGAIILLSHVCFDLVIILWVLVNASEPEGLASASLVGQSLQVDVDNADRCSLDVPCDSQGIDNSPGVGRVIPVENSRTTHVLHGESTVEVLADIATDVLLEHECATWVMEVVLGQVNDEIIYDGNVVSRLNHLHELVVRYFGSWCREWDLTSAIKLEPNLKTQNEASEPYDAYNIHAKVEASVDICLTKGHE